MSSLVHLRGCELSANVARRSATAPRGGRATPCTARAGRRTRARRRPARRGRGRGRTSAARLRTSPSSQSARRHAAVSSVSGWIEQYSVHTAPQPPSAFIAADGRPGTPGLLRPGADAVRHLVEAVVQRLRADLDRLEEDVVLGVARHELPSSSPAATGQIRTASSLMFLKRVWSKKRVQLAPDRRRNRVTRPWQRPAREAG